MRSPTITGELETVDRSLRHASALRSSTGGPVSAGFGSASTFTAVIRPAVEESRFSSAWMPTAVPLYSTTVEFIPPAEMG